MKSEGPQVAPGSFERTLADLEHLLASTTKQYAAKLIRAEPLAAEAIEEARGFLRRLSPTGEIFDWSRLREIEREADAKRRGILGGTLSREAGELVAIFRMISVANLALQSNRDLFYHTGEWERANETINAIRSTVDNTVFGQPMNIYFLAMLSGFAEVYNGWMLDTLVSHQGDLRRTLGEIRAGREFMGSGSQSRFYTMCRDADLKIVKGQTWAAGERRKIKADLDWLPTFTGWCYTGAEYAKGVMLIAGSVWAGGARIAQGALSYLGLFREYTKATVGGATAKLSGDALEAAIVYGKDSLNGTLTWRQAGMATLERTWDQFPTTVLQAASYSATGATNPTVQVALQTNVGFLFRRLPDFGLRVSGGAIASGINSIPKVSEDIADGNYESAVDELKSSFLQGGVMGLAPRYGVKGYRRSPYSRSLPVGGSPYIGGPDLGRTKTSIVAENPSQSPSLAGTIVTRVDIAETASDKKHAPEKKKNAKSSGRSSAPATRRQRSYPAVFLGPVKGLD